MLNTISDVAQNVSEAIKSAFQMDVEIVDTKFIRIAATGNAISGIGEVMKFGTASRQVIKTNQHIIIDNAMKHSICLNCPGRGICTYSGGVIVPIKFEQETIGTINIVAYNEEKLNSIKQNLNGIIDFLYRMSDLMTSKINEEILYQEEIRNNGALLTLINSISKGIISINEDGYINHFNKVAEEMINVSDILNIHVSDIFEEFPFDDVLAGRSIIQTELILKNNVNSDAIFVVDIKPIKFNESIKGAVISLSNYKEAQQNAFNFINPNYTISIEDIIGKSHEMIKIKSLVEHVSANNSTILITGESGTGKELFARAIHQESQRKNHPFISINCGAIPEALIESELFGYERGSFTGASSKGKLGKFELADKGTIFLDEIGTMPIYLQTRLLRVLQMKEIDKIGAKHPIPVDIRVIAATNENLEELVSQKKFREDLYYRLNVIPIHIPPLRERKDDIKYLTNFFIRRYNRILNRNVQSLSNDVINLLNNHDWPGNVRELENCVEYAINMTTHKDMLLELKHMPLYINESSNAIQVEPNNIDIKIKNDSLHMNLRDFEYTKIKKLIHEYGSSTKAKKKIATMLGISLATLYRRLKKYNLN